MHLITVGRGAEVPATIQAGVGDLWITAGAITAIGAVQMATGSVMHQDDALADRLRHHDLPMESSGTGEIVDGRVRHAETATFGGHLHAATVREFFVRAYVAPLV